MMKEFTSNGVNWLIVQVPKETREHNVDDDALIFVWVALGTPDYIDIPPGQYDLFCIAEKATEEQAALFMGYLAGCWADFRAKMRSLFPDHHLYKHVILKKL